MMIDDSFVAAIEGLVGRDLSLSLSDEGSRIAERLGAQWFAAVIRPIALAYPSNPIDLIVCAEGSEPMSFGTALTAAVPGDAFTAENGIGILSIDGDGSLERVGRRVSVPSQALLDDSAPYRFGGAGGRIKQTIGRVYGDIYRRFPVVLDVWRQSRNSVKDWRAGTRVRGAAALENIGGAPEPSAGDTAWFALHWLEPGGAESWAFEAAQIAKDAGLRVIITADKPAPHRAFERALAITDEIYLAGNVLDYADWEAFERALVTQNDVAVVHIHHAAMAYQFLPELRHLKPGIQVVDSLHIIEHRTGGFVRQSLEHSNLIDLHHVISPALRDEFILDNGISADKVIYRPLTGLSDQESSEVVAQPHQPLRVGFLGRLAVQKRPFLFLELAKRVHKKNPGRFHFVMQGSGSLADYVASEVRRARLGNALEQREWGPVEAFFDDVDVLVISSDNEGLTLTALEADAHGVVVLSADVGSQVSVVAPELLVPARPVAFLRQAAERLENLARDPAYFERVRAEQHEMHRSVRDVEPASSYFATYFASIRQETR